MSISVFLKNLSCFQNVQLPSYSSTFLFEILL